MQLKHFLLFFCFLVNMQSSVAQELPISYPYQTPTLIISSITFLAVGFGLGMAFMYCMNNKKIDTMSADIEKFKQKQAQQEKDFVEIFGKLQILKDQLVKHKSAIQSLLNTIKIKNNCTVCFPLITKRMINGAHPQSSL